MTGKSTNADTAVERGELELGPLSYDAITRDFSVWQRKRGHRYSIDDVATAALAIRGIENTERPVPQRIADIGCGLGSVLTMLAWYFRDATLVGIEALDLSFALAKKNVAGNGLTERVTLHHGDLREVTKEWEHAKCDLVTGTPPYLPLGTALPSPDPQRTAARIELRGGVEDYLRAAARIVAPSGLVVVCADGRRPERVLTGAAAAELTPIRCTEIIAREGNTGPLFSVWHLIPQATGDRTTGEPTAPEYLKLIIRGVDGNVTPEAATLRGTFGMRP